jgi:hypothetical protein
MHPAFEFIRAFASGYIVEVFKEGRWVQLPFFQFMPGLEYRLKQPSRHAALMEEYAKGAEIQVIDNNKWYDVEVPTFIEEFAYRIKPKHQIGSKYKVFDKVFLLSASDCNDVLAIEIATGIRFRDSVLVKNLNRITDEEVAKIFDNTAFQLIHTPRYKKGLK